MAAMALPTQSACTRRLSFHTNIHCIRQYTLEAISVNEVGSGLMIQDTLQGVPVNISATIIMQLVGIILVFHLFALLIDHCK
jgi:hypothetical protein